MTPSLTSDVWGPRGLTVLRVMTSLLFIAHGLVKLFGFPEGAQPGQMPLLSLLGLGAVLEVVGGGLVAVGLFTRPAAFILSGEMAVGYFMFHAPKAFLPVLNGGDAAILFCFVFLYFACAGAGPYSLDANRRSPPLKS
ncbi:MAG: DoxX family protein [Sphingomonadales bacterium 32-67-7]|nr:MAG: DoxX family protein [Sphingomonadales bacterium 32-67-7]